MKMTNQHPITPPPELILQWLEEFHGCPASGARIDAEKFLAARAAQWGADQELEACFEWLDDECRLESYHTLPVELRDARRPKPPSLAEEALAELAEWERILDIAPDAALRRALKRLQELEGGNG